MCYFFQAEDGIRDIGVTGVQTCALPIFGAVAGAVSARRVRMTAMPQMVALFNGVGGGAAALVSLAEFHELAPLPGDLGTDEAIAVVASALIGSVSFAGSMVAFAKLQELIGGRPDRKSTRLNSSHANLSYAVF